MDSEKDAVVTTSEFRDLASEIENSLNESEPIKDNMNNSSANHKKFYYGYRERVIKYLLLLVFFICLFVVFFGAYQNNRFELRGFTENSTVNYSVCLKENEYYKEQCLDEGREYITSLTDYIRLDFNYTKVYQEPVEEQLEYYIGSKVEILYDNEYARELFKEEEQLTDPKKFNLKGNVVSIVDSVDLPVSTYDIYVKKYFNDYGLHGNAKLKIALYIINNGKLEEASSVSLPLKDQTYHLDKNEIVDKNDTYQVESKQMIHYLLLVLVVVVGIVVLFLLFKTFKFLIKTSSSTSKYDKKLKQILNTYDKVIVTLKDNNIIVNDKPVYTVETFLELLDVRDTIDKPILYYKVNSVKTEFYVQDIDRTYKYTLKEADLTNEK